MLLYTVKASISLLSISILIAGNGCDSKCNPDKPSENNNRQKRLSKEKIVEIAKNKAKEIDIYFLQHVVIYDEHNMEWHDWLAYWEKGDPEFVKRYNYPKGSYQAVRFKPKPGALGADLWVLVDPNTGEVIDYCMTE